VTVGDVEYTFKASVTTTADQVKVGATAYASAVNLAAAINADGTGDYGSETEANPYVYAIAVQETFAPDPITATVAFIARTPGVAGNLIPIEASLDDGDVASATLLYGEGDGQVWAADILAVNQVNSEVQYELLKLVTPVRIFPEEEES